MLEYHKLLTYFLSMKRVLFLISLVCVVAVSCNDKSQSTPYLKLSENDLELWFDESEHSVVVESSDEWSATSNNEWITVKTVSGKAGEENLVFAVSQNNTDAMRSGSITLQSSHPDLSRILTIKQYDTSAGGMSISYTTIDKKPVSVYNPEAFDGEIVSNEYQNGIGTITFSRTVTAIFELCLYYRYQHPRTSENYWLFGIRILCPYTRDIVAR